MHPHSTATITRWYILCGQEALQPVDGRLVALRIGEGHHFPTDQISVSGRAAEARCSGLLLPENVGQRVGGTPGQDQSVRHFEGRKPGVEVAEPASDHCRLDAANPGEETLIAPGAPSQA